MGSETIPPCKENVVHITLDKPLELPFCQFKLLRESSLVKSRMKEIHARLEMPLNERTIYKFDLKNISYLTTLQGSVPPSFLNYLTKKGHYKISNKSKKSSPKKKKILFKKIYKSSRKPSFKKFGPGFIKGKHIKKAKDSCYVHVD